MLPASPPSLFESVPRVARRPAPFLPMTRQEMQALGWEECDVIIVTGDAYVDHPSFGMAIVGRLLEAQGLRVGIIAQPAWQNADAFRALGRPRLFFGVTAGNMDSMVNRYTSDKRIRSDDAYTPGGEAGKRPDRSVIVYSQRLREAYRDVPIVIGGIEASLRRIAHFDYWSEKVRRSVLLDAKADLLLYGNAERQVVDLARRLDAGETIDSIRDLRGTVFMRGAHARDYIEIDSRHLDAPGPLNPPVDPYAMEPDGARGGVEPAADAPAAGETVVRFRRRVKNADRDRSVIRMPDYEQVADDPVMYAHASRILHLEANPHNARALVQRHGNHRRVDQPAAHSADHAGDGRAVRAAVPAPAASLLWQGRDPGLQDDPLLHLDPAWLLRWLQLLLHHRARGSHHPEPLRRVGAEGDRDHPRHGAGIHRRDLGPRWSDGEHVPHRLQEPRDRGERAGCPRASFRKCARTSTPTTRR